MADAPQTGPGTGAAPTSGGRRRDVRLVLMGVAAVLLVWFALANLQDVEVHFWVHTTRTSLVLVVLISGLLGSLLTVLLMRRRGGGTRT